MMSGLFGFAPMAGPHVAIGLHTRQVPFYSPQLGETGSETWLISACSRPQLLGPRSSEVISGWARERSAHNVNGHCDHARHQQKEAANARTTGPHRLSHEILTRPSTSRYGNQA